MSKDKIEIKSGGGIGFFGLLGVLFIGLKLGGIISWPWVWVLAPIWGPFVFLLGVIAIVAIIALVVMVVKAANK